MAAYAEKLQDEEGNPAPIPPELSLAFQVEKWGKEVIFGQEEIPAGLLKRMSTSLSIYNAFASQMGVKDLSKWAEMYPQYLDIVARVRTMRANYAG